MTVNMQRMPLTGTLAICIVQAVNWCWCIASNSPLCPAETHGNLRPKLVKRKDRKYRKSSPVNVSHMGCGLSSAWTSRSLASISLRWLGRRTRQPLLWGHEVWGRSAAPSWAALVTMCSITPTALYWLYGPGKRTTKYMSTYLVKLSWIDRLSI